MASAPAIRFCMCLNITAYSLLCFRTGTVQRVPCASPFWGGTVESLHSRFELDRARLTRRQRLLELPADVRNLFRRGRASHSVLALDHELFLRRERLPTVRGESESGARRAGRALDVVHVFRNRISHY